MKKITFRNKKLEVKEKLSMAQATLIVNSVTNVVVDEHSYDPLYKKVATIVRTLETYTNIDGLTVDDVFENIGEYDELLSNIQREIDLDQYMMILTAIDNKIEFEQKRLLNTSSKLYLLQEELAIAQLEEHKKSMELLEKTNELNSQFDKNELENMMEIINKMNQNFHDDSFVDSIAKNITSNKKGKIESPVGK